MVRIGKHTVECDRKNDNVDISSESSRGPRIRSAMNFCAKSPAPGIPHLSVQPKGRGRELWELFSLQL